VEMSSGNPRLLFVICRVYDRPVRVIENSGKT
jgi:hypothetical protein